MDAVLEKTQFDLAQQVSDWEQLHEMSLRLVQERTLDGQLQIVLEAVAAFHGSEQGVISLFDEEKGGLITHASFGVSSPGLGQLACVPVGAGACGLAFKTSTRVLIEDTETNPIYAPYREFARNEGIGALYSTPFISKNGKPLGVLSIYFRSPRKPDERELRLTDICANQAALFVEREEADRQLRREQERSHRILETMKDGFILLDRDFRILKINAEGLKIDGRQASDIVGKTHWEAWPGSENVSIGQAYIRAMAEGKAVKIKHCYEHFGREMWFDVHAYPSEGGLAVLYRDITEQRKTEVELTRVTDESERRRRLYETILANTPDLAYVFDLNHRFTYANEILLKMWGKSWDEAVGKNCLELGYEPWHAEMHDREIERVKATKLPIRGEVPFNGTFGRRIYDYIFVPVLGPNGEVEAVAGTTRDVTERKEIEETLREANRRKDEFLAMLAHELRNPLAPISTAASLLKLPGADVNRIQNASDIIVRQVKHMTELVDDLLDVSRVTRGLVQLEKKNTDLKSVVSNAIEQARPLIEAKRHVLNLHMSADEAYVYADRTRLVQVVVNLLNNSAKYTPPGGQITLTVKVADESAAIEVQDNGCGIDSSLLPQVFDLFTQAERTPDRAQGGLGIGLALVKNIVTLHGGQVAAESAGRNQGSVFRVTLPVVGKRSSLERDLPQNTIDMSKLKIMIADDNVDAAMSLAALLETVGHTLIVAADGKDALEKSMAERPDVFILDIGLPDMTGYELVRLLREKKELADKVFVALTGYGQDQDRILAKGAGFHQHFVKPVDIDGLFSVLASTGSQTGAPAFHER